MENNDKLLEKITYNSTKLDKDTIVDYMKKYGACIIPNFISDEKCDIVNCTK